MGWAWQVRQQHADSNLGAQRVLSCTAYPCTGLQALRRAPHPHTSVHGPPQTSPSHQAHLPTSAASSTMSPAHFSLRSRSSAS